MQGNTLLVLPCGAGRTGGRGARRTADAVLAARADALRAHWRQSIGPLDQRSVRIETQKAADRRPFFFFYSISSEYQIERLSMPTLLG
jgi:hypothetical protein